jgi:hypothetical protein
MRGQSAPRPTFIIPRSKFYGKIHGEEIVWVNAPPGPVVGTENSLRVVAQGLAHFVSDRPLGYDSASQNPN